MTDVPLQLAVVPEKISHCETCNDSAAKYKCPGCSVLSCSVACVKTHKKKTKCTGIRVQENKTRDQIMLEEYRFLEDVRSKLEDGLHNPLFHHLQNDSMFSYDKRQHPFKTPGEINPSSQYTNTLPHNLRNKNGSSIPNYSAFNPSTGVLLYRKDIPQILKRLRNKIMSRGTKLSFMPRNMSRRKFNTTHFCSQDKAIKWHVVLRFIHANVYFEKTVDENLTIGEIISEYLSINPEELKGNSINNPSEDNVENSKQINANDQSDENSDGSDIDTSKESEALNGTEIDRADVITSTLNTFCSPKTRIEESPERELVHDMTTKYDTRPVVSLNEEQQREMLLYQSAGQGDVAVLLINEDFEDSKQYNRFYMGETLKESLVNIRIVEYPILIVMRKDHVYEFMGKEKEMEKDEIMEKLKEDIKKEDSNSMKYFDADNELVDEDD